MVVIHYDARHRILQRQFGSGDSGAWKKRGRRLGAPDEPETCYESMRKNRASGHVITSNHRIIP